MTAKTTGAPATLVLAGSRLQTQAIPLQIELAEITLVPCPTDNWHIEMCGGSGDPFLQRCCRQQRARPGCCHPMVWLRETEDMDFDQRLAPGPSGIAPSLAGSSEGTFRGHLLIQFWLKLKAT